MFPPLHTDTHSHPPAALTGSPRGPRSPGEPGAPLSPLLPCKEVVGTQVQDTLLVLQTPPSSPAPSPPPPRQVPAPFGAHPLSRRTVRARGALVPHLPCGSRLTPVARSTLQEQARPDKSVGFGAKPHVPAGPGASSALGPKVEWGLHTNLLSRAAGDPLPARLSIFPRLPLHKDTTRQGEQGHISTRRWVLVPC